MDPNEIDIRPLAATEIPQLLHLPWSAGLPKKHQDRHARQQADEVAYLVAWYGSDPIGHLLLKWSGPQQEPMASRITSCAEIEDFVVMPDLRHRGVGHRMLVAAESLTRRRGLYRLGLGIGLDNPRARALYERFGFIDANCGVFTIRWQYPGEDGEPRWAEQRCRYLVKVLAEHSPQASG